jgi:hypothetical protein
MAGPIFCPTTERVPESAFPALQPHYHFHRNPFHSPKPTSAEGSSREYYVINQIQTRKQKIASIPNRQTP